MPVSGRLARFLHVGSMNFMPALGADTPIEDRIDQIARLVLIALLLVTLAWAV